MSPALRKTLAILCLFFLVAAFQYEYDAVRPAAGKTAAGNAFSPAMVRLVDGGFHAAVASFLWAGVMPEILDLFHRNPDYLADLPKVTGVDPRLGYPYAFSVLTLPAIPTSTFPDAVADGIAIGLQGLKQSDPDWRIPYYLAADYFILLHDKKDALAYYDIAARTPGIPEYAERFSLNFGIGSDERQTTIALWETLRDSTNDEFTKERAQAYIDRLNDLDYLEAAATQYKKRFGAYPTSTDALVAKGIIPSAPEDPFGFTFIINPDGTAGIDLNKLPSYILSEPAQ